MVMPMWAIIFRPWPDTPVYHRHKVGSMTREVWGVTVCGREISRDLPWLPTKHVVKFARPCKGCFPE